MKRAAAAAAFALLCFAANSVLCRMALRSAHIDPASFTSIRLVSGAVTLWLLDLLAALSGAVASGLGYAAWYTALPRLGAIAAANAQLAVPVVAALAGVALFGEPITGRLLAAAALVLAGTALAVRRSLALRPAR